MLDIWCYIRKLRQIGLVNQIVGDSDTKKSKFKPRTQSDSKADDKIRVQLKDNFNLSQIFYQNWAIFDKI